MLVTPHDEVRLLAERLLRDRVVRAVRDPAFRVADEGREEQRSASTAELVEPIKDLHDQNTAYLFWCTRMMLNQSSGFSAGRYKLILRFVNSNTNRSSRMLPIPYNASFVSPFCSKIGFTFKPSSSASSSFVDWPGSSIRPK